jgi:hypothetical protein
MSAKARWARIVLAVVGTEAFALASALSSKPWTPVLIGAGMLAWMVAWLVLRL